MQITINQTEIVDAIHTYIRKQGIGGDKTLEIALIAGRGPNGHSATIDILTDDGEPTLVREGTEALQVTTKVKAPPSDTKPPVEDKPKKSEDNVKEKEVDTVAAPVAEAADKILEEVSPPVPPASAPPAGSPLFGKKG